MSGDEAEKLLAENPEYRVLDENQFAKLKRLASELHGGSDRERDYGHRLWLIVLELESQ